MSTKHPAKFLVALVCLIVAASGPAQAQDEGLISTMAIMPAVASAGGISIVPAADIPANVYTGDLSAPQVFEIARPDMGPITVGRLHTSCACLSASMEKKSFGAGERAILTIRNIKPTPASGATYAVFVQVTSPIQEVLQLDLFVKSDSGSPAPAGVQQPAAPASRVNTNAYPRSTSIPVNTSRPNTPQPPPFTYEDITPYTPRKAPEAAREGQEAAPTEPAADGTESSAQPQ